MVNNNNDDYVVVEYTEESKKKMHKKSFKIITIIGITLVVLIVATYAWFVGITTVYVDEFDVDVEALKGLEISFDGSQWFNGDNNPAQINKENHSTFQIQNNRWVSDDGLVPISSPGVFSSTGHLKFYSNTSMEPINGGYNIRTVKIDNENTAEGDTSPEKGQYITFDMFLKNTSNTVDANATGATVDKGEAVYLTVASDVYTKASWTDDPQDEEDVDPMEEDAEDADGIENSVRVGFYEVASASLDTQASDLRNLSCSAAGSLCSSSGDSTKRGISWNIWEPNDNKHKAKAITAFGKCKVRNNDDGSYSNTQCNAIVDGTSTLTTYAVNKVIAINDGVNIYDGLNGYNVSSTGDDNFLKAVTNLKESTNAINMTNRYETNRAQVFRLLPNSITKIRVYIWLEGQDPDNLDYSGSPKKLVFSFGFTKDMYEEELAS